MPKNFNGAWKGKEHGCVRASTYPSVITIYTVMPQTPLDNFELTRSFQIL